MTNATDWRSIRDADLEQIADAAESLLLDRTIVRVRAVPHDDDCAGANVLRLTLDNGVVVDIEGGYDGYSRHAHDEYVERIDVSEMPK